MDMTSQEEAAYFYGALGDAFGYGAASDYSTKPTLSRGSKDVAAIQELQRGLMAKGYNLSPYNADGDFGPTTEAAVKKFQADNKLAATGVVDSAVWATLLGSSDSASKQDKALSTLDTILQGVAQGMTTFAPMFGPKQDYAPPATTPSSAASYAPSVASTGMSTGTKVGIGVLGLVAVGGTIYLLVSRRN